LISQVRSENGTNWLRCLHQREGKKEAEQPSLLSLAVAPQSAPSIATIIAIIVTMVSIQLREFSELAISQSG
jgi:hypothetical protein